MAKKSQVFIYWCVFIYFIILFLERVQSLVFSLLDKGFDIFNSYIGVYAYGMVCLSLVVSIVIMITINYSFFPALVSRKEEVHKKVGPIRLSAMLVSLGITVVLWLIGNFVKRR